ncbi:VanZ family protein [Nocardioides houyundeii]|uniref:VanZ family protein n=1 Tax=Nocardioides houyundeii TaxID=2045452 RepID=UPI000C76132D|nr:VanZ family protein [Nocardioides houyundeii]
MLFGEVPALPVVAPVTAVALGVLLWRLQRRGALSPLRVVVAVCVCIYGAGVVANTIFPIFLDKPGGTPPWSSSISMTLFDDYELSDAIQNVVVFIPLGVLLPLIAGTRSLWRVAGLGVLLSLLIETAQFFSDHFLDGGHVADINDFFFNAVGAPVGYGIFMMATRTPILARLADRMSWPSTRAVNQGEARGRAGASRSRV